MEARLYLPRNMFPALAGSDCIYLNSGGTGPPSRNTLAAMREADDLLCGPAYAEGSDIYARQAGFHARAREAAARLIKAAPDDVALTLNTSHGMSLGAFALDWREGDEVISATSEHPGCLVPLHVLRERYGVRLKLLSPPITADKVETSMTERTRLVALSHVDWTNGEVLPLAEISARARLHGAITLVDGAQSAGNIPVDVSATGADLYAFTGHKWVLGPEGMGALYVRPGLTHSEAASTNLGYAAIANPAAFDPEKSAALHAGARRFEGSTMSPTLSAGFAEAMNAVSARGQEGFAEIRRRADLLMDLLEERPNVALRSPRPARSGLVSFEVEDVPAKEAYGRLLERGFVARFLPEPFPWVRASTHLFNSEEELGKLARAVAELRA